VIDNDSSFDNLVNYMINCNFDGLTGWLLNISLKE